MKAKPCSFEFWRNYVPNAPDLTFDVSNFEPTEIDLHDIIMQGSGTPDGHSPTPGILDKIPTQRGWRHTAQIISPPTKGNAVLNAFGDALTYYPRSGLRGQDCLNYILSNGTQKSAQGRIFFNLTNRYRWKLLVTRKRVDKTLHNFQLISDHASGMPPILYMEVFWYYSHYVVRKDPQGVNRVFYERERTHSTRSNYQPYVQGQAPAPIIIDPATDVDIYTDYDTTLGAAFNGWSNLPYSPKGVQGDIEIEIRAYTQQKNTDGLQQVDLDYPTAIQYRLSDILGTEWWDSGNIQKGY